MRASTPTLSALTGATDESYGAFRRRNARLMRSPQPTPGRARPLEALSILAGRDGLGIATRDGTIGEPQLDGTPDATIDTPTTGNPSFVGQVNVLTGLCIGGPGHCAVPKRSTNRFDKRPRHHKTPSNLRFDATAAVQALSDSGVTEFHVNLVVFNTDGTPAARRDTTAHTTTPSARLGVLRARPRRQSCGSLLRLKDGESSSWAAAWRTAAPLW